MRLHFWAARRAEQTPILFINLGTIHFHLAGSKRRLSSSQHSISLLYMRVLLSGDVLRARCVCRWKRRFAWLDKWKTGVLKGGLHIHSRASECTKSLIRAAVLHCDVPRSSFYIMKTFAAAAAAKNNLLWFFLRARARGERQAGGCLRFGDNDIGA